MTRNERTGEPATVRMIRETGINRTENYGIGSSDWYEPSPTDKGGLFRALKREYGRCTGRIYIDIPHFAVEALPVGWVFEKRVKYDDDPATFLQETWVEYR